MLLSEIQHLRLQEHGGTVTVFARKHGKYIRPVVATELDMRIEDNQAVPKVICLNQATWIARHPTEALYIVWDGLAGTYRARVTPDELEEWAQDWQGRRQQYVRPPSRYNRPGPAVEIPQEIYQMPTRGEIAWWEWVQAFNNRTMVKAAKKPRPGEPTPEAIDEKGGERPDLEARLSRIFR